jgi:putative GTP pyrophosphokinase
VIDWDNLRARYADRLETYLRPMVPELEDHVRNQVDTFPRIDRVAARAKDIDRFMDKAAREIDGKLKYSDPLNEIQDQMGVRIVTYYASDLPRLREIVLDYFAPVEEQLIVPDDASQFGYEGLHYVLFIPDDIRDPGISKDDCPEFFEMQIKTLFQHAWAEANHDLAYKSERSLAHSQRRRVAFTAAQAWGADHIFDELVSELVLEDAP